MKNRWSIAALMTGGCMLLAGCGQGMEQTQASRMEQDTDVSATVQEKGGQDKQGSTAAGSGEKSVVMVYMVGSNLESEGGMASIDIVEMASSGFDEDNMEVLVCTGGASQWWIEDIPNDACTVFSVTNGELEPVYTLDNENMADSATLREFINYGYMNHEADYYDLVLWNHGGGAVLGYGLDENHGTDALSMTEMKDALDGTKLASDGEKFEWIGFDACLMGMLEVADAMDAYANYLIASEEVEAGAGWNYACLAELSDGSHFRGDAAAEAILDNYSTYYESQYNYAPDYTLSCLDLSKTEAAVASLEEFVGAASEELKDGGYSRIARMRDRTKTFGKVSQDSFYDTVDLYDLADKMMHLYPTQAANVQEAVNAMVVCQSSNVKEAHGVAIYFPYSNRDYAGEWVDEYKKIGFSDSYTAFIASFADTLSGEQLAQWDIREKEPIESGETLGEYYVQLDEEQTANFGHGAYSVWEEDSEGTYICWVDSSEVSLSEDGVLSADFDGRRFFLTDASGELHACCAVEIERNKSYVKYAIPVILERQTGEKNDIPQFDYDNVYIHIKVDAEHPEGAVVGVYETLDTDSTLFPTKNLVELKDGDSIIPFLFARDIVFREDGSVAPFEEWEVSSGASAYFLLEGELSVTMQKMQPGTKYCFLFKVHDTQGNYYMTNPIYIES